MESEALKLFAVALYSDDSVTEIIRTGNYEMACLAYNSLMWHILLPHVAIKRLHMYEDGVATLLAETHRDRHAMDRTPPAYSALH